jgi:hypothetical protein
MESLNEEDYKAKDRAFYSAMISAWLNTRIERDKQLLGLSVTAIGLLVTLLRTVGVSSFSQMILFGFALFAFLTTVISVIYVLDKNAAHIEEMLRGVTTESQALKILDKTAEISFVLGMLMIVIIGMHSAAINLSEQGTSMSKEKQSNTHHQSVTDKDSWNGVSKLRPQPPKPPQTPPNTNTNESNTSASSGGSGSGKTSESGSGS